MIVVKDLRVDVLGEPLFEKVNLVIKPGERIGLLSPQENTTVLFFGALAGTTEIDDGTVTLEGECVEYVSPATIQEGSDSLARVLHARPSFLLIHATGVTLAEDIERIEQLIKGFRGGILLASEDTRLMQTAKVTRILEVHPTTKLISSYTGSFAEYMVEREKNQARLREAYEKQQKEKRRLEELIDQKRAAATQNRSPEIGATIRAKKKYLQREILDKAVPKPFESEDEMAASN